MKALLSFLSLSYLLSCNGVDAVLGTGDNKKDATTYSYACLDSAMANNQTGRRIDKATALLRDITVPRSKITDSVQTTWGAAFHKDMMETGESKLIEDKALNEKLTLVLNNLLAQRSEPSKIRYYVYALDDIALNAFTFGGRIYVTKTMIEKCRGNDALLYAIIGHEIGHSEKGHIKETIQDMEFSQKFFGNGSSTYLQLKSILAASFNQKNELEADYYGINLTNKLGMDLCTAVSFWREMAGKENKYSKMEDFLRTHPFSESRAKCLSDHIRNNFGKDCGVVNAAGAHEQSR